MSTGFFRWSKTPANNATATYRWDEGQPPSSVNDSARGIMSDVAQWRDDIGGLLTTATSTSAYTLTSNSAYDSLTNLHGMLIAFTPHGTNTNAVGTDVTLAVDGLTAKPIRMQQGIPLPAGSLIIGTPYSAVYNNTDGAFYLHNMTNPYQIPLGAGMDYWGSSTPNAAFAFPAGQQISQTTYASLYALFGSNRYGPDGGGLFYLPDKTGRVSAMKEASATRLTSAVSGVDGATLGSAAGAQSQTLVATQVPNINSNVTASGNASNFQVDGSAANFIFLSNIPGSFALNAGSTHTLRNGTQATAAVSTTGTAASSNTGSAGNGSGSAAAHANVQPTIVCNYIIRVL